MNTAKPLRIAYLSGPAEAVRFLRELEEGTSDYFGTNYMKQFLRLAEDVDAAAYIVTWHEGATYRRTIGRFEIDNRPLPQAAGLRYHLLMLGWHLRVLARVWRFGPDIMLVTGNPSHWWVLSPLRLRGTRFIASYHGLPWDPFRPRKAHIRLFSWLNRALVLRSMPAILTTSQAIKAQVETMIRGPGRRPRLLDHLPSYQPEQFAGITPALDLPRTPFQVIFIGRVEIEKGVFDLLAAAEQLQQRRPGLFRFDICGGGGQEGALRGRVAALGLEQVVSVHGYCGPDRIRTLLSRSHVSVVPTRSECTAGFEMNCAEAILAGRPLVTSEAAPAIAYVRPATIEVRPDNVDDYADAILRLYDDPALYASLVQACEGLQRQFYDERHGWTAALREALRLGAPREATSPVREPTRVP